MNPDGVNVTPSVSGVELTTVNGLPAVSVNTELATALVYLQGAQLAAWQPTGRDPVIWLSPRAVYTEGKALRGGVPLCFPWFGDHPIHREFPAHGFARVRTFQYRGARTDEAGRAELEFGLDSDARTLPLFPHAFSACLRVAIGTTLGLEFTVTNRDDRPFSFEEALHSYFAVADVREAGVLGLERSSYTDKVRAMAVFEQTARELRLEGETDRVYESSTQCAIVDHAAERTIRIQKKDSQSTVVWNPWAEKAARMSDLGADAWSRMLCVESANVAPSRITLGPAESHRLTVEISVHTTPDFLSET